MAKEVRSVDVHPNAEQSTIELFQTDNAYSLLSPFYSNLLQATYLS